MANKEYLSILMEKGGVTAWNKWRSENWEIIPDLSGAQLSRANLSWANLRVADLSSADLSSADLRGAKLRWADLSGANLAVANLHHADLSRADLSKANLSLTNLHHADLSGANLSGANLGVTSLHHADLSGANLNGADLRGADLSDSRMGNTSVTDIDLSGVKGLETVSHLGPSSIGIDTIYRSKANISESFLRGAGVPENFITFMKSLVGTAIEYYSCFISYSTKDKEFAERLHADLQAEHIRCWFAPEDLKIGDKFRPEIDEAIRKYDKLLLILSENSIRSAWVEKEFETAFEKERKQDRIVLFPIRLDDAVMKTNQAWAADIRRTRHIGDFSNWKNHDEYKKGFDRLLRDLKAEAKPRDRARKRSSKLTG